ncbi:MAG TPA: sigma-70 family RNA polymerase sigma factor [Terriglobia bacterium]|nr:sigma-70 family RNA polymerase sigma factor [Terriglobia bacterium]
MATHLAEEPQLVAAARQGDNQAFCVLINQYYWNVYNVVLKIARNNEDTEDALQDAFLKAYCNVKQFQGNSRFYTWLVRIAVNEALMKLRKRHSDRQVSLEEVAPYGADLPMAKSQSWNDDPERRYAELEAQEILHRALSGLSPRLSTAFMLRNVDDLSMRETAETLGLSSSAVKSRLIRARSRLKRRLRTVYSEKCALRQAPQAVGMD